MFRPAAVAILLVVLTAAVGAAQTRPATRPALDPALEGVKFTWLLARYNARGFRIMVQVNGKQHAVYDKGSGFDSKPMPLRAGKNEILVDVINTEPDRTLREGTIDLHAADGMMPSADRKMAELCDIDIEDGAASVTMTIDFVDQQPRDFKLLHQVWYEADRKALAWQMAADGDGLAATFASEKQTAYRANGKVAREVIRQNGMHVTGLSYKPDGAVADRVTDGSGVESTFRDDGSLLYTKPIRDGLADGEEIDYHRNGKSNTVTTWVKGQMNGPYRRSTNRGTVYLAGQYKDGQPDGRWTRLDDDGTVKDECLYQDGQLVKGTPLESFWFRYKE